MAVVRTRRVPRPRNSQRVTQQLAYNRSVRGRLVLALLFSFLGAITAAQGTNPQREGIASKVDAVISKLRQPTLTYTPQIPNRKASNRERSRGRCHLNPIRFVLIPNDINFALHGVDVGLPANYIMFTDGTYEAASPPPPYFTNSCTSHGFVQRVTLGITYEDARCRERSSCDLAGIAID